MTTCNKRCFCNSAHRGLCEGLIERAEDKLGVCKFQKNHRNDTRHYIPVKLQNGLMSFMEARDEQKDSGRYIAVKLPNGLTTFMEVSDEQARTFR